MAGTGFCAEDLTCCGFRRDAEGFAKSLPATSIFVLPILRSLKCVTRRSAFSWVCGRMRLLCGASHCHSEFFAAGFRRTEAEGRCSRQSSRFRRVYAGDNKRQPNFIDIGGASRRGWDEVKVVRTTQPVEPKKEKRFAKNVEPARTPVSLVDVKPEQQNPIVEATKRGRGGKTVTVIKGLQLRIESLEALCKSLKVKMGSGGAVKDGEIEIQGDQSAKLVEELLKLGYKAKKSGR